MDLLVLNHRDPCHPRAGGSEVVLWEVCRRLSRLGVRVTWMVEHFPNSQKDDVLDSVVIRRRGNPLSLHLFSLLEARKHEVVLDSVAHAVPFFSYLVNPYSAALVHHVHQDVLDLELGCRDTLGETKSLIFLFNFLCVFTILFSIQFSKLFYFTRYSDVFKYWQIVSFVCATYPASSVDKAFKDVFYDVH